MLSYCGWMKCLKLGMCTKDTELADAAGGRYGEPQQRRGIFDSPAHIESIYSPMVSQHALTCHQINRCRWWRGR